MALLGKFGLSGTLDKVLSSGDLDSPKIESALDKLLDNNKDTVAKVIEHLQSGPKVQYTIALKLLGRLIDNTTIEIILQALPHYEPNIQKDIATLLNTNRNFDPHLLLAYLKEPLSLEISRDMIMAHRRKFTAAKLLQAVAKTKPDLWEIIFELVHGRSDEAAFPEAVALSNSKNTKLRTYATEVIANYDNPAAIEALLVLLKDQDKNVHLSALRGLTRLKANLPAEEIFQLMQQMTKDQEPLVRVLITHCVDLELMTYINMAILGKKGTLKPFAIKALTSILNKDNLRSTLQQLTSKSDSIQSNILQSIIDSSGDLLIAPVALLLDDPEPAIRKISLKIIDDCNPQNPLILGLIRQYVTEEMPTELKISFITKLGQNKDSAAVPKLLKTLGTDAQQSIAALRALENIADESVLADVFEMLDHDDENIQIAALSCLLPIIPKKFAKDIREQLLSNVDKLKESVLPTLITLLEAITDKHHLPDTTAYRKTMDKLKSDASGEIELSGNYTQVTTTPSHAQGGNTDDPFGSGGNPFGDQENDVFGSSEAEADTPVSQNNPEGDFAIELKSGMTMADRYKLVREIGRGGYGSVWLVEDTFIQDEMVMKFLHQQLVSDEIAIERFIRELRLARKITHTNIIRLFDYIDFGKVAAISMEYFPGKPLSNLIHQGAVDPARVVQLTHIMCMALETAHQAHVVHRDMKPANILVDDDNMVKIVDFGIAAASKHAESRLTRTGTLVGTPTYISPEQIQGNPVDGRSDQYSLGIIMYEMLAGATPYRAEDPMALVFMHVEGNARRLDETNPAVSKELADIVHRCIKPNPDDRYATMTELAQALDQLDPQ